MTAQIAGRSAVAVAVAVLCAACGSPERPKTSAVASPSALGTMASEEPVPEAIEGCVPACSPAGLVRPGSVPTGDYKTEWFFGSQLVITLEEPWSIMEDSTSELSMSLDSTPENGVFLWEDVYPVEDGKPVRGVPPTADGLLAWFRSNPDLVTSKPHPGQIGDLPATIVDVGVSDQAVSSDPTCSKSMTCVLFLGFPRWDAPWGIASLPSSGSQVQRFYLSDVSYGGQTHLFVAVIYPDVASDMDTFGPHGEDAIASVKVPATPAAPEP